MISWQLQQKKRLCDVPVLRLNMSLNSLVSVAAGTSKTSRAM